jgi:hypothetical protein
MKDGMSKLEDRPIGRKEKQTEKNRVPRPMGQ